jgi:serine/threonine protein kinase
VGGNPHFIITGLYPPAIGNGSPQQAMQLTTIINIAAYVLVIALFIVPLLLLRRYTRKGSKVADRAENQPVLQHVTDAESSKVADHRGNQLGNYRIIRILGEGGFAEVYLGEHLHLGTQAAIKVLHTQLTGNDMEQFRTEARTIARLEHPNIIRVLDFGIEGKIAYLAMDYATNGTLRQRYPKGTQLSLDEILPYVKQVAAALQYAHDQKIIHRDVKPENMLLDQNDKVLLSDFGIAVVAHSTASQVLEKPIGTPAYIAPEQLQGKPCPASDQYALGIVVYEWLSGDLPFNGSFSEIDAKHPHVPPPFLHEKIPTILPEVEHVVMKALAKDPKDRFESVQAFATALEQASRG